MIPKNTRPSEVYWIEREPWLRSRGYGLRTRLTPGWEPSWIKNPKLMPIFQDDALPCSHSRKAIDALRLSDGQALYLKPIMKNSNEEEIARYLMNATVAEEAKRYLVPIFEILDDIPGDDQRCMLVMPRLQKFWCPRFETVGECLDCIEQLLEAVQFLHHHKIAHRDCQTGNILMEGDRIFPYGFHPVRTEMKLKDPATKAFYYTRTQRPSRYLLIDFGNSIRFPLSEESPQTLPVPGGDLSVPEFMKKKVATTPYNPFPTDIYYIGNTVRRMFLKDGINGEAYHGLEFLRPFIDQITLADPSSRLTADDALEQLRDIIKGVSTSKLRSRVRKRVDNPLGHLVRFFPYWKRRIVFTLIRTHPIPSRNVVNVPRHRNSPS